MLPDQKTPLKRLSEELFKHPMIQEFDRLNQLVVQKYRDQNSYLEVYVPFDSDPLRIISTRAYMEKKDDIAKGLSNEAIDQYSDNKCVAASHILTGMEVVALLVMIETLITRRINNLFLCIMMDLPFWPNMVLFIRIYRSSRSTSKRGVKI
jgi:hypothetical protein